MLACETPKFDCKPGPLKAGPGPVGMLSTALEARPGVGVLLAELALVGPAGPPLSCDGIGCQSRGTTDGW
jgi:hypothetical protein